jgi:hypothetical protein
MEHFAHGEFDALRIEIELDEEVVEALVICSNKHCDLSFSALARLLLVQEALQMNGIPSSNTQI